MLSSRSSDRFAVIAIAMGIIATALTGLVHYQITNSSHFDFIVRDQEFFLMLGFVFLILAFCAGDLWEALRAITHLKEPHRRFVKPLAIAGITLGIVDIVPAILILLIIAETLLLKLAQVTLWINVR